MQSISPPATVTGCHCDDDQHFHTIMMVTVMIVMMVPVMMVMVTVMMVMVTVMIMVIYEDED